MTFPASDYLDFSGSEHARIFEDTANAWEVLPRIKDYLHQRLIHAPRAAAEPGTHVGEWVFIGANTRIDPGACILGPAWIGSGCHIRSGCYIRENVILGNGVVAGNSCEFKNCVVLDDAEVPHFNYVGDSLLGRKSHLGAGVILSNVKLDKTNVRVRHGEAVLDTGLRKFGAVIGDRAQIGCNAVINPGSLVGRDTIIYAGVQWRGVLPAGAVAKLRQDIEIIQRTP
jgi:NDP-sugar pyrophosphorylase family protein